MLRRLPSICLRYDCLRVQYEQPIVRKVLRSDEFLRSFLRGIRSPSAANCTTMRNCVPFTTVISEVPYQTLTCARSDYSAGNTLHRSLRGFSPRSLPPVCSKRWPLGALGGTPTRTEAEGPCSRAFGGDLQARVKRCKWGVSLPRIPRAPPSLWDWREAQKTEVV